MHLHNLHMSAICKLGMRKADFLVREKWIVKGLKLKQIV